MTSRQIIGYGGTVERSTDDVTYAEIPEVKSLAIPTITQEYPEVTSLDSSGGFREYIKGMKDAGEISLEAGYTTVGYQQQVSDNAAPDAIYYRVTFRPNREQTTGDVFEFRGFPTPTPTGDDIAAPVMMTINIRITGEPVFAAGASIAPSNSVLPSVSGIAQVGQTLTAIPGTWAGSPTFTYQWQLDSGGWGNIVGATASTYVPLLAQIGEPLRVIVTGTNSHSAVTATSGATANVIAA